MKRLANQTLKDNALPDKSPVHSRHSGLFYQIDQNLSSEILYKYLQHHKPGTIFMCRRLFPKDPSTDLVQLVVIQLNGCHVTSLLTTFYDFGRLKTEIHKKCQNNRKYPSTLIIVASSLPSRSSDHQQVLTNWYTGDFIIQDKC